MYVDAVRALPIPNRTRDPEGLAVSDDDDVRACACACGDSGSLRGMSVSVPHVRGQDDVTNGRCTK